MRRIELPLWFSEGVAEYWSGGEDTQDDMILRDLTLLDEAKSGLCALLLGEALLTLLKSEKLLTRREMLDLWDISKQEEIREQKREDLTEAERLSQEPLAAKGKKSLDEAKKMIDGEFDGAEALLRQKASRLKEDLQRLEPQAAGRFQAQAIKVAQQLEDAGTGGELEPHPGHRLPLPAGTKARAGQETRRQREA